MPLASKSTENMLDLLPLPGFRPISLSIHNSDFDEDRAKRAMEACKFVHTASVDSRDGKSRWTSPIFDGIRRSHCCSCARSYDSCNAVH